MKVNDDGIFREEPIRRHHNDKDLKAYMQKRQKSNPELFRWNSVDNERRIAVDFGEQQLSGSHRRRQGAEIELHNPSQGDYARVYNI